jgi:hypothetical protein
MVEAFHPVSVQWSAAVPFLIVIAVVPETAVLNV